MFNTGNLESKELLRRLSFIKYLFTTGQEQSTLAEPLCSIAMLSFHDSIESLLVLGCEHHNIGNTKNLKFDQYFAELESKGIVITQRTTMQRFNNARVALKHHGTTTSKIEIETFKINCANFLRENTLSIFGLDFDAVSMMDLVLYETTKNRLVNAEKEMAACDYKNALSEITFAFWEMIEEYEDSKKYFYGKSPFSFGKDMTFFMPLFWKEKQDQQLLDVINSLKDYIDSMQSLIKIISLGFDYKKFAKFNLLTPNYFRTMAGGELQERWDMGIPAFDDVNWCLNYVIECCIILQNFDYTDVKIKTLAEKG
ncbi:hypothetical protein FACS1894147_02200 [Spirochaetia bacterium]|nr:hypothetical protein FACS1894147_02200 [Spirochaetia bacterium]